MNPHQKNKVDISSLSADEQRLLRLYGKLPNKKDLLQNKLKERKYFDSGDYALSKAGKASDVGVTQIGREHPNPDNIPHLSTSPHNNGGTGGTSGSLDGRSGSISGSSAFAPTIGADGVAGPGLTKVRSSGSPVKESSFLNREESIDDQPGDQKSQDNEKMEGSVSPPPQREGMPIRGGQR